MTGIWRGRRGGGDVDGRGGYAAAPVRWHDVGSPVAGVVVKGRRERSVDWPRSTPAHLLFN
jgi:hypothetical protein